MLAALDACPAPSLHPSIYLHRPIARTISAQQAIFEIAAGAPMHPDEYYARFRLAMDRCSEMDDLLRGVVKQLQHRLGGVLAREVSPGEVKALSHDPLLTVRSMNFDAFLARAHQHSERLLAMSDEALAEQLRAAHP